MGPLTNIVESIAASVASQVGGAITAVLSYLVNGVQKDVIEPVTSGIDKTLTAVENSVNALSKAASSGIENTLTAASNSIGTFISSAETGFTSVLSGVEHGVQNLAQAITTVFQQVVSGIEQGFTSISGAVGQAISTVGNDIQKGIDAFSVQVTNVFTPIFSAFTSFIEGLPGDLATIAGDVVDALTGLAKIFEPALKAIDEDITRKLPAAAESYIEGVILREKTVKQTKLTNQLPDLIGQILGVKPSDEMSIALGRVSLIAGVEAAIGMVEELFPGAAFIMAELLNHIADSVAVGDFRTMTQAGNQGTPNELIGAGQAILGRYRGTVSDGEFYEVLAKSGYTKKNADVLFSNSQTLLGLHELIALYKRGGLVSIDELYNRAFEIQVTKEQVDNALTLYHQLLGAGEAIQMWRRGVVVEGDTTPFADLLRAGFTKERISALQQISHTLPSVFEYQDFVARKVDDQAHVDKFQLDYGINDEYFTLAKAQGFDEKTARRIYRSYWNLPPFFLLASEFKAGKINEQTFRDALAFQRYTPYWIDVFVSQLKPTLTQGDIKDMYKYQIITAAEIVPKLEAIGTANDLAHELSQLWQASIKLASPHDQTATQVSAAALKGETKALIITAYKDALLKHDEALAQLEALGETQQAASLTLSIADHDLTQQNIKDVFAASKENYLAGNITLEQVLTDLAQAGATTAQQNKYYSQLQYAGRSKPKSPTLAEFMKWFKTGHIDASELIAALQLLGYSDIWIPFYLLEAGVTAQAIGEMGYTVTMPTQA